MYPLINFQIWFDLIDAYADFIQMDIDGVQEKDVKGHKLSDGTFIFIWDNSGFRKMVLTSSDGEKRNAGFVRLPIQTWEDASTWTEDNYTISNFKKVGEGMCYFLILTKSHLLTRS